LGVWNEEASGLKQSQICSQPELEAANAESDFQEDHEHRLD